jgi:alkanesulfonate monooxygenase SsuD/methylene tetrahydromethanopterin reductase-like flavin-dependent oxidoreductase (luciferase family)
MADIAVSVQAEPTDLPSWLALARRLESAGFRGLVMGDHPGSGASPWPALGRAAAVTQALRLGTYVVQAGVREPVQVAADAATLDLLAPGRVRLGIGAGHTPREWEATGRRRPAAGERAARLAGFVDAVAGLPVGGTVEIAVGGGHPEVLRAAARRADVVALSGLGRTLPDGHHHEARWSAGDLRRQLQLVRDEARRAGTAPIVEALVQAVTVTEDRASSITQLSEQIAGASAEDAARTPFLLVGTYEQMAAQLLAQAEELGIASYVVREAAVPHLERVLSLIRG